MKTIFFDLDGVLVDRGAALPAISEYFNLSEDELKPYYLPLLKEHELGTINERDFWSTLASQIKSDKPLPNVGPFNIEFSKKIIPNPETLDIVKRLKSLNIKLCLISNNVPGYAQHIRSSGVLRDFDLQIFSFEAKMRKPAIEIYQLALDKTSTEAKEALFIDDNEDNVRGAASIGIQSLQFVTAKELEEDLQKLKIL